MSSMIQKFNNFVAKPYGVTITALIYTFMFGCAFPLVKICISEFGISSGDNIGKCLLAGVRFFLSGLVLMLLCRKITVRKARDFAYCFSYGIFGTSLKYACTYIGLSVVSGSKGAILDQIGIFVIIIFGGLFFKGDKLTLKKILGCLLGLIGIVAVGFDGLNFSFSFLGEGMIICAALFNACEYFVAKHTANKISPMQLVGIGQFFGGLVLCIYAICMGGSLEQFTIGGIVSLIALVLISSFAYVLSLIPLKFHPVSKVSIYNLLITVFGVVMSAAVLRENILKIEYLIAVVFVSMGICIINTPDKMFKND